MLDSQEDNELIQRAHNGSTAAIGALYDRHQPHIFRFVWSRVGNQQVAEDLTGDIFTRMVAALPSYQIGQYPFRAWLYRIARNLVTDEYRAQKGKTAVPLENIMMMTTHDQTPDTIAEKNITLHNVQTALARIDARQREVVELRFLAGMSLQETAESLELSLAAAKSLQHRGLQALRVALKES
ncbi:MAG: sigma-70 family RNA polymerase sigma factor [Chloroflexota bacterium]